MRTTISHLRKKARLTQEELAKRVGITRPYLSQLETGERNLSLVLQERIADVLGCDPHDLVDFTAGPAKDEDVILKAYRQMPREWQRVLADAARRFVR